MSRLTRLCALPIAAAALIFAPAAASAHVDVDADGEAVQGGFATLSFSIPNERSDAATVTIQIKMPDDTPIPFALPAPIDGWEPVVTTRELVEPVPLGASSITVAADVVTWTATAGGLSGGDQMEFKMLVGPFPLDAVDISFPTVQTYDSGEVVRWIEPELADGSEPELPMPVLSISAGTGEYAEVPLELVPLLPTVDPAPPVVDTPAESVVIAPEPIATEAAPTVESAVEETVATTITEPVTLDSPSAVAGTDGGAAADSSGGSSTGLIVGGLVALVGIGAAAVYVNRRNKSAV